MLVHILQVLYSSVYFTLTVTTMNLLYVKQLLECFPEFRVENGIDERIDT